MFQMVLQDTSLTGWQFGSSCLLDFRMFHLVLPSSFDRQQRGGRVSGGVCSCQFTCFMHLYTCTLAVVHLYRGEGGCLVVVVAANSPALCTQKNCGRGFGCSGTDRDWYSKAGCFILSNTRMDVCVSYWATHVCTHMEIGE